MPRPIQYRDRQHRVWYVTEVARLKLVSPAIDGPNVALVIRFEHEGQERFARWIGGEDWRARARDRLFTESERVGTVERPPVPALAEPNDETGVGPAPAGTVALWVKLVATMGPTSWRTSRSGRFASGIASRCSTCAERSSDDGASSPASYIRPLWKANTIATIAIVAKTRNMPNPDIMRSRFASPMSPATATTIGTAHGPAA
jgi:hypothetical protein